LEPPKNSGEGRACEQVANASTNGKDDPQVTQGSQAAVSRTPVKAIAADATTRETAAYVKEITESLRRLTRRSGQPLAFLDYLLAIVADEAEQMSAHQHH
jgi:hypothetical protein